MTAHFGETLNGILARTGMSQGQLAMLTGLSLSNINRALARETCPFRPYNLQRILTELAKRTQITPEESAALRASTLDAKTAAALQEFSRSPDALRASSLLDAFQHMRPDEATAHQWLEELMERTSPGAVLQVIQAAATIAGIDLLPAFRDVPRRRLPVADEVRVVSPPVQRDGYVEQRITHYERPSERPSDRAGKPNRKTGS